jgi:hypothetical protein
MGLFRVTGLGKLRLSFPLLPNDFFGRSTANHRWCRRFHYLFCYDVVLFLADIVRLICFIVKGCRVWWFLTNPFVPSLIWVNRFRFQCNQISNGTWWWFPLSVSWFCFPKIPGRFHSLFCGTLTTSAILLGSPHVRNVVYVAMFLLLSKRDFQDRTVLYHWMLRHSLIKKIYASAMVHAKQSDNFTDALLFCRLPTINDLMASLHLYLFCWC